MKDAAARAPAPKARVAPVVTPAPRDTGASAVPTVKQPSAPAVASPKHKPSRAAAEPARRRRSRVEAEVTPRGRMAPWFTRAVVALRSAPALARPDGSGRDTAALARGALGLLALALAGAALVDLNLRARRGAARG